MAVTMAVIGHLVKPGPKSFKLSSHGLCPLLGGWSLRIQGRTQRLQGGRSREGRSLV